MGFADAVKSGFANYVNFSGRAPRAAFWWWYLFYCVALMAAIFLDTLLFQTAGSDGAYLYLLASVGLFLPTIALGVRRLHDVDRSGAWLLIMFIPLVGFIMLLIWFCTPGTWGSNSYGASPYKAA